jgi:hypothetical protein
MVCYHVYVPLLLRLSNDVEENPGPKNINDNYYTYSVHADFHQGHALIFVEVNFCFALSKASVTVKPVQRLHRLSSKSFNIIY